MPGLSISAMRAINPAASSAAPAAGRYWPLCAAPHRVRAGSRRPPSRLGLEIQVSQSLTVVVADDVTALVVLFDVPGWREAALGQRTLPAQATATRFASRSVTNASAYDAAVMQLILNGIGHIGMRRGISILKAAMLRRIQFERELVALTAFETSAPQPTPRYSHKNNG